MDNSYDLKRSLDQYKKEVSKIIFDPSICNLYKNKYKYWTKDMENLWREHNLNSDSKYYHGLSKNMTRDDMEIMHFIKAVVHSIVDRCFNEEWDKEKFLEIYNKNIEWINNGVSF